MNLDSPFKVLSYAAVFCGYLSLWISGTFGIEGTVLFVAVMAAAWFLEDSRWQISERVGTVLIVAALPLYYLLWRYGFFQFSSTEAMLPGILARLILTLTAVKLLQKKSDRDWIFLYVMAFFQILLAAGLSISAGYLGVFVTFVFVMACTIILFEIRRSRRAMSELETLRHDDGPASNGGLPRGVLPSSAVLLIVLIIAVATPMFFMLPRVGGAGIGGGQNGVSTSTGFSDTVRLGGIGTIQQNDAVVMRVRVEEGEVPSNLIRWRGVALDTFDGQSWSRARANVRESFIKGERDLIQVGYPTNRENLVLQTFYLEPLDTPILFGLPKVAGVVGNFPVLFKDIYDSISFHRSGERITYKALSDVGLPDESLLREDSAEYSGRDRRYLQLPRGLDPRIRELANSVAGGTGSPYDEARAIEYFLQTDFGYTLEQKAGGADPLADFLFNVREGHCEYFATAMAVMLRTRGVATRVVNGFQRGEYNETADVFVVRQRNAHSWVEVYFPSQDVWVPFDPTPAVGQNLTGTTAGITAVVGKYFEALEMFWIQYFVAFDNQEQRSLFTSMRRGLTDYNTAATGWVENLQQWVAAYWERLKGERGASESVRAVGFGVLALAFLGLVITLLVVAGRAILRSRFWPRLGRRLGRNRGGSVVEFYQRFLEVLQDKGWVRPMHLTPLEFAHTLGFPEAVTLTERYYRVRFGEDQLSDSEEAEIQQMLEAIKQNDVPARPVE